MNIGLNVCLLMCGTLLLFAILFALLKGRGAVLIAGFNTLPKQEQAKYDKEKMIKDFRNEIFTWSAIFAIGALLCYFITSYFAILAFIVWLVCVFRGLHFYPEKAFAKYRL